MKNKDTEKMKEKKSDNDSFSRFIISGLIWLGSGFISIILMTLLTGKSGIIPYVVYFTKLCCYDSTLYSCRL